MKKKIISLLLAVVMIAGMLPLSAIPAFAEDKANGEYTITNEAPESEKDTNNGYVYVPESAEAGTEVTIDFYPNEGYALKRLAVKYQRTNASQDDSSEPVFRSPMFRQIGGSLPTNAKIVAGEKIVDETGFSIERVDTAEISTVELATGAPGSYSFTMPAYPITVLAEFDLSNPEWTNWEPFDIGTGEWNFCVLSGQSGSYNVEICEEKNHPYLKLIKVASWGADILASPYPGIDLILKWNTDKNEVTIPEQDTGLVEVKTGQKLTIQDYNSYTFSSLKTSYYNENESEKAFHLVPIYIVGANAYYNDETLVIKEKETSEKLQYDSEEADFSATFKDDTADIEIVYDHDEDEWVALVHATDPALHTVALCVYLPNGYTEIPAGTYPINKTMEESTVQASSGIVNGSQVTYSFAGNRNSQGYITTPIWFMVGGTVTVSYEGNVMTMVIDAVNSYGKDIDVTIEKVIPPKHNITDATTDPNGSVLVDQTPAEEGSAVTLTVFPKDGYRLKAGTLKAVYNDGGEKQVDLTQDPAEKNKFTFIMPTADVTVTAEFEEAEDTFKAVWDAKTRVLSFFYDKLNHMGEGISVFDELPTEATAWEDWPYDGIREDVAEVLIDASVANYTGLKSTAYMFSSMLLAENITGTEYLNTADVTNMEQTFADFGCYSDVLNVVPNVSGWNTEKVTNMNGMFSNYGFFSDTLDKVPDVSGWNTEKVTDMSQMFYCYGYYSSVLNAVPDVSTWKTAEVTDMNSMFLFYGCSSAVLNKIPDIAGWDTENVTDLGQMFQYYGYSSEELVSVPNISAWDIKNVKNFVSMFNCYGVTSQKLNFSMDLSGWDLSGAENIGYMFNYAGADAKVWKVCIPYRTGELENTPTVWYGKDDTVFAVPATGKQFTLFYPVSVDGNIQNGKVETNVSKAESNTTVSLTVTPDEGYMLKADSLKATCNDDGEKICELTPGDGNTYTFTMPAADVTVTAEFESIVAYNYTQKKEYASLADAISEAVSGDEIELWAEENAENVVLPDGVTLYAKSGYTGTVTTDAAGKSVAKQDMFGEYQYKYFVTNVLTITYKDQGDKTFSGTHESGYPTIFIAEVPTALKAATKDGYTFGGWYDNADCTGDPITGFYAYTYTDNLTLYAKWICNHTNTRTKVNGQAPTETAAGWKDYYECGCGDFFEDATGNVPIEDLAAWKAQGGNGYLPQLEHTHAPVLAEGTAATLQSAGFKSYYKCDCGKFFEDATCEVEITDLAKWKSEGGNGYLPKLEEEPTSPKTGDNSNMTLWIVLMLVSAMGLCVCLTFGKRKRTVK